MLYIFEQVYGGAESPFNIVARLFGGFARFEQPTVVRVDAQLRHTLVVEMDVVFLVDLLDVDFRLYVMGALRGVLAARIWFELANDLHLLPDLIQSNA